jgi:hypothetical protein
VEDIILTGRNPKADAKLIADVLNASTQQEMVECDDPYDGGCPADIMPSRRDDMPSRQDFSREIASMATRTTQANARGHVYRELCDAIEALRDRSNEAITNALNVSIKAPNRTNEKRVHRAEGYRDGVRAALQIVLDAWHADNQRRNQA